MWAKIRSWFTKQPNHEWRYRKDGTNRKCYFCNRTERKLKLTSGVAWIPKNKGLKGARCSEK